MMQSDLEPDFMIEQAARFIIEVPKSQRPRAAIVEILDRFPQVGPQGACRALALANKIRSGGCDAAS